MLRFLRSFAVCSLVLLPLANAQAQGVRDFWNKVKKDAGEVADVITDAIDGGKTSTQPPELPPAQEVVYNQVPDRVAQVQGLLGQLGFPVGPVDGAYGPGTRSAIIQFQSQRGLPSTGNVTASLIAALENAVQVARVATPQTPPISGQTGQSGDLG